MSIRTRQCKGTKDKRCEKMIEYRKYYTRCTACHWKFKEEQHKMNGNETAHPILFDDDD